MQVRQRHSGESFLSLVLADRTGEVAAVMWEGVEGLGRDLAEGDILKVQGLVGTYQGERQVTVARLRKATADEVAPLASVKPFIDATPATGARIIQYPGEVGVGLQHLGILVGRQARAHVWPEIISWIKTHS